MFFITIANCNKAIYICNLIQSFITVFILQITKIDIRNISGKTVIQLYLNFIIFVCWFLRACLAFAIDNFCCQWSFFQLKNNVHRYNTMVDLITWNRCRWLEVFTIIFGFVLISFKVKWIPVNNWKQKHLKIKTCPPPKKNASIF